MEGGWHLTGFAWSDSRQEWRTLHVRVTLLANLDQLLDVRCGVHGEQDCGKKGVHQAAHLVVLARVDAL